MRAFSLSKYVARAPWRSLLVNSVAGLSVGAYLIPQAMAYGELAGVGPAVGLGAALVPLLVYPLVGRHHWLSMGPESAVALMAAATAAPIAVSTGLSIIVVLPLLSVLAGVFLLGARFVRAAALTDLLSKPVLVGYLSGVALLMAVSQLGNVLGSDIDSSSAQSLAQDLAGVAVNPLTVALTLSCLVLVSVLRKFAPKVPALLLVLVLGALVGYVLPVPTVGELQFALPSPSFPALTMDVAASLAGGAAAIALVSYTDVLVTARAFDDGARLDPRHELTALGTVQLATGLTGGYPASASSSRTAIARASGASSRFYSYAVAVVLVAAPLAAGSLLAHVPLAVLAAIVITAALGLVDVSAWMEVARVRRSEVMVAFACALGVVFLGILPGVLVAIGLSVIDVLVRLSRPHEAVLGVVPGVPGMHSVEEHPAAEQIAGLVVYRYDAPLFFANANDFYSRAMDAAESPGCSWLILNMEAVVSIDSTGLDALRQLIADASSAEVQVGFARVKADVLASLERSGVADEAGTDMFFATLPAAVDAFRVAEGGAKPAPFGRVSPVHKFARLARKSTDD